MRATCLTLVAILSVNALPAQEKDKLADALRGLDARVLPEPLPDMLAKQQQARIAAAHERMRQDWAKVSTRADWEKFRNARSAALRAALALPAERSDLKTRTTRKLAGEGFIVHNLVFESRPGLLVTANLYRPDQAADKKMPGIVVVHGFHQPKSQAELQDMGMTWARLGCAVLVPDVLGHGERPQHPFRTEKDFDGKFNLRRQDYYARANAATQLELAGESLAGWMIWDTIRCVDLLLARDDVDPKKIIVLGAVAAGGDVAAQAAALDERIAAVAPFNYGGPEPETVHPLPAEANLAELAFPYGTGGHWDRTRRLQHAFRDGFYPWVVNAAVAPRRLIYAHEFAWDRERDPAWKRIEQVYQLAGVPEHLASANGSGTLFGNPEGTGCANIGPVHRQGLYPPLEKWFDIARPEKEYQKRFTADELLCLTADERELKPRTVQQLAASLADGRLAQARQSIDAAKLRAGWQQRLGNVGPGKATATPRSKDAIAGANVERLTLKVEPGIVVPVVLLIPTSPERKQRAVVVMIAQQGKDELLKARADEVAGILKSGAAVCLADVRGVGETLPRGDKRGAPAGTFKGVAQNSPSTLLASGEQLLGETLLGARVRDLRTVLAYLRGRSDVDKSRLCLWGDSLAATNPIGQDLHVPWDAEKLPHQAEPLGALAVMLTALFEDDVAAVVARGGLVSYRALLDDQFLFVPADVIVPGALTAGDLPDVAAVLKKPLRVASVVDGRNRPVAEAELARAWPKQASLAAAGPPAEDLRWLVQTLAPR